MFFRIRGGISAQAKYCYGNTSPSNTPVYETNSGTFDSKSVFYFFHTKMCFILINLTFHRFYAIVLPYHRRERITKKKVGVLVASCWVFAFFFNAPLFVVRKFNDDPGTGFFCRSSWPDNRLGLSYNYLWLMFVGVIPVCVMVLFYGKIVHNLWHSERQALHGAQLARLNSRKRVTKILVTLNIIYAFCWFPNLLINVIVYYIANPKLYSIGYLVTELLVLLNSSINPFVYALQSKQFRIAVKNILCCRKIVEVRPLATFDTRAADSSTGSVNMPHLTQR